jgi:hypothetical protein
VRQFLLDKYIFPFAVVLGVLSFSSCEKNYDTVIDSAVSTPVASDPKFSLSKVYTDTIYNSKGVKKPDDTLTIRGFASIMVSHAGGKTEIAAVRFSLIDNQSSSHVSEGILLNDGIFPDQNAFDSVYSRSIDFQIRRVFVGKMMLSLWSEDRSGRLSNTYLLPLEIIRRDNQKPFLSNLTMDSLVVVSDADQFLQLKIKASDPDGQSDILKVFFNSYKPGGSPSVGNPFQMYDDGNENQLSGDMIAGDGIYGIIVRLPATATIGKYRFEFHAVDRSLDSSNVIIKNMEITN